MRQRRLSLGSRSRYTVRRFESRVRGDRLPGSRLRSCASGLLALSTCLVALPIAQDLAMTPASASQTTSSTLPQTSSSTSRPDPVSAAIAARITGAPVLIESDQTDTSRTYANPDGSKTTDYYSAPVQVDQNGTWTNIDTTLVQNAYGTFSPKAAVGTIELSGGGSGDLASLSSNGRSVGIGFGTGSLLTGSP